jgi:SsrA-binding protein
MKALAYNKRAPFDYELIEKYEAGLVLLGTEVKSVRAGHMSLRGAFVTIHNNEAYLTNATIPPWQPANTPESYDPVRPRRLLLKKEELKQLIGTRHAGGLTIIPIRVYTKGPHLKLEIALAKGKKKFDKKEAKKERDIERDVDRLLRGKE